MILPDSAVPGLVLRIAQARGAGAQRWRVMIPANVADPREQRAAYLRLMSLRHLLLQQGYGPADVDLWIDSSAGDRPRNAGVATMEPLSAELAAAAGAGAGQ